MKYIHSAGILHRDLVKKKKKNKIDSLFDIHYIIRNQKIF